MVNLVKEDLRKKCLKQMKENACTKQDPETKEYAFAPVFNTSAKAIGEITNSVGVSLYFSFLKRMGFLFLVLFGLSFPMFLMNCWGSMVDANNPLQQGLASTSVANIGKCPEVGCASLDDLEERCLWTSDCHENGGVKVKQVTEALGLLDGLSVLVFMSFCIWLLHWFIPHVVDRFDQGNLTPSDYTIRLDILPRYLGGKGSQEHKQYKEKLKQHFLNVLSTMQDDPVTEANAVYKVSLVREYNGAIKDYIALGKLKNDKKNAEALKDIYTNEHKNASRAANMVKKLEDFQLKIKSATDDVRSKASRDKDEDRAVVSAFVTFNKIEYAEQVLVEYRFSEFMLFRACQSSRLRFGGEFIRLRQATEPSDLYWENLDYNPYKRVLRQVLVGIASALVLIICAALLVSVKASTSPTPTTQYSAWAIRGVDHANADGCISACNVQFFNTGNCLGPQTSWEDASIVDMLLTQTDDIPVGVGSDVRLGNVTECSAPVESSACDRTEAFANSEDWIGVQFSSPINAKCMSVVQRADHALSHLELYACPGGIPPLANRIGWSPAISCLSMQGLTASTSKRAQTDEGVQSGAMAILPDWTCPENVSFAEAEEAIGLGDTWTETCFCKALLVSDPNFISPPYDTPEKQLCQRWSEEQLITVAVLAGGVAVICVLNQILVLIFSVFIRLERLETVTEVTRSQLSKLFAAQFVNTGLLMFLVNAKFGRFPGVFQVITGPLQLGKGNYYQVNADWFMAVGTSLCITILSQVVSTTITPVILTYIVAPTVRWIMIKMKHQVIAETLYPMFQYPEWNLALRLAQTMNIISCVIFYAGGLPILYFVGMLYCGLAYWMDKYSLLRGSRRPPAYSEDVIQKCLSLAPFAAFLHTIFACSVLGDPSLFPSDWSLLLPFGEALFGVTEEEYDMTRAKWQWVQEAERYEMWGDFLRTRLLDAARKSSWLLLLIFLVGCLYYIFTCMWKFLLRPILKPFVSACKACVNRCLGRKNKLEGIESDKTYEEALKEMKERGLPLGYEMSDSLNSLYQAAAEAIIDADNEVIVDPEGGSSKAGFLASVEGTLGLSGAAEPGSPEPPKSSL